MSFKLSKDQIKKFKEYFALFDKDGDGIIKSKEVGTVIRAIGFNPLEQEVQDAVKQYDHGNGTIDLTEFLEIMAGQV